MAIDIFNPDVSVVVKGITGKSFFIYGANGTGKTSNLCKAEKPFVIAFENGLGAIPGIPNAKIKRWTDFQKVVKQLTDPSTIDEAKKHYSTIIVDGVDLMDVLADPYVAGIYGVQRVKDGNEGYGLWKEYSAELVKQINALCSSGYTIFWISHDGEREFPDPQGNKYVTLYPKGDKRVVDPLLSLCDIVAYAELQKDTAEGKPVQSTLHLIGNSAFMAKSRFKHITRKIPEWDYEKLAQAIVNAIDAEEKIAGKQVVVSADVAAAKEAKAKEAEKLEFIPVIKLVERIGLMLKQMNARDGNLNRYIEIMVDKLGTKDFKCNTATEAQREQVEVLYYALLDDGFTCE